MLRKGSKFVIATAAAGLVLSACGSSGKSATSSTTTGGSATSATSAAASGGGGGASAPGVTATTIKIGVISGLSGFSPETGKDSLKGVEARVDAQNAAGGVDGRKIELVSVDGAGTPAGNTSAAKILVQSKGVFAIIDNDAQGIGGAAPYTHQNGIPVTGQSDSSTWGTQSYTNLFGSTASPNPKSPASTTFGTFFKQEGVKNVCFGAYGVSTGSVAFAKAIAYSARQAGLATPYTNTSVSLSGENWTADGLAMKNAHCDGFLPAMTGQADIAMYTAAKQAGANLKVTLLSAFDPASFAAGGAQAQEGTYYTIPYTPPEVTNPGTTAFKAAISQYAGLSSPVDQNNYEVAQGYIAADLMIFGLQQAGTNPTRSSFITNLRQVTNYTANGMEAAPMNISTIFGTSVTGTGPNGCVYFLQVKSGGFVLAQPQPVCGTVLPNSNQL